MDRKYKRSHLCKEDKAALRQLEIAIEDSPDWGPLCYLALKIILQRAKWFKRFMEDEAKGQGKNSDDALYARNCSTVCKLLSQALKIDGVF